MKTEAEIRKILEYIESINAHNFSESEKGAEPSYTSIFSKDKNGKPEVLGVIQHFRFWIMYCWQ